MKSSKLLKKIENYREWYYFDSDSGEFIPNAGAPSVVTVLCDELNSKVYESDNGEWLVDD